MAYGIRKDSLWQFGIIPYEIDFPEDTVLYKQIVAAVDKWNDVIGMPRFVYRNGHINYAIFTASSNNNICLSSIGISSPGQKIYIADFASTTIIPILHEMAHTAGLMHEHQRFDRDDYITVHPENIDPTILNDDQIKVNYNIVVNTTMYLPLSTYDCNSIMHYNGHEASKPGTEVITFKHGNPSSNPNYFSPRDITALRCMYDMWVPIGMPHDGINYSTFLYSLPSGIYILNPNPDDQTAIVEYKDINNTWYFNCIFAEPPQTGIYFDSFTVMEKDQTIELYYSRNSRYNGNYTYGTIIQKIFTPQTGWQNGVGFYETRPGSFSYLFGGFNARQEAQIFFTNFVLNDCSHLSQTYPGTSTFHEDPYFPRNLYLRKCIIRDPITNRLHLFLIDRASQNDQIQHIYEQPDCTWATQFINSEFRVAMVGAIFQPTADLNTRFYIKLVAYSVESSSFFQTFSDHTEHTFWQKWDYFKDATPIIPLNSNSLSRLPIRALSQGIKNTLFKPPAHDINNQLIQNNSLHEVQARL